MSFCTFLFHVLNNFTSCKPCTSLEFRRKNIYTNLTEADLKPLTEATIFYAA